ncbi:basic helix-loop-helix DNA-binding superfamily protein, partial [Prunus dulcis]
MIQNSVLGSPNSNLGTCGGGELLKIEKMGMNVNTYLNSSSALMEKGVIKESSGKAASGGGNESEHGMHTWTERERRKKMRDMFSSLHALLPQLPAKACNLQTQNTSTIVDESVRYIKSLEKTLQTKQKQKLDKLQSTSALIASNTELAGETREAFLAEQQHPSKNLMVTNAFPASLSPACFKTWFSPTVVVNICGPDAQFSVCSPRKPGLLTTILYILEKHELDVVSAHISSDQYRCMYMIHAHAGGAWDHFPEALSVEDTFKLAA